MLFNSELKSYFAVVICGHPVAVRLFFVATCLFAVTMALFPENKPLVFKLLDP